MVEVDRVRSAVERYGDRFVNRVYTVSESGYCDARGPGRHMSYAARFAAKEAVAKALGTGFSRGVRPLQIEVANLGGGAPAVNLYGRALEELVSQGYESVALSLTHTRGIAAAVAILT